MCKSSWSLSYYFLKLSLTTRRPGHLCFSSFSQQRKHDFGTKTKRIPLIINEKSSGAPAVSDIYRCNVRISDLGRHGKVKEARKLFDEMPQRNSFSYASMITVYVKNNDLPGAERLFRTMPPREIVSESAMINAYVKAGRVDEARKMFEEMAERNVFSWTSLISGYFWIRQVEEGRRLFDRMPVKTIVSWITVVLGYAQNGLIDQARDIFDKMPEKNVVAWTAMIKSYVENDLIDEAFKLFHDMPQRNLFTWNIMISACLNANRVTEAIQLFNSMPQRNSISWTCMVSGLARNGMIYSAREYFDQMPSRDIAAWNAMITAYADEGNMDEASELFQLMPSKNVITWNAIIDGYSRSGPEGEALRHLILMFHFGLRPDETTITSVLTSCEAMLELTQVHALVIPLGFEDNASLVNALITKYSRIGELNSARLAFESLKSKDLVSWTSMILAYSNHGYGLHALNVFARMLRSGVKPDEITFVGVLSACSHAGLVEKGQRLFDSMRRAYGLKPWAEHYSCLVDVFGRAGQVEKAMRVVSKMPLSDRDGAVLGALLGGYVLLANVYAACEKWDEFAQVRKMMKERNVKKVPGYSQIEVKGKNHVFFVGDRTHPQVQEVYEMLTDTLLPSMQERG
ncbi:hypothetical protein SLEP1_g363 [Rubroshorea leprosula]|uniref:Pentatricopeptide repeat-containing protein n=1 Tax=Rubroshorea leprosula TaxID=152421 RepID=A0AAV5HJ23_9ROSI|nr:hypothetical protein SLEP1_g363 [Rubroshorea leprosula]